jgi:hypothetical protein
MTEREPSDEGADEVLEDLEAPAEQMADVAGGVCPGGSCRPTNNCAPVNTVIHTCEPPTQFCVGGTCLETIVLEK